MLWETCTWRRKFGTNGKTMAVNLMFDNNFYYFLYHTNMKPIKVSN